MLDWSDRSGHMMVADCSHEIKDIALTVRSTCGACDVLCPKGAVDINGKPGRDVRQS